MRIQRQRDTFAYRFADYELDDEARGNTAHRFMERAGLGGKRFRIKPATRNEADALGVTYDQLQRHNSAEVEKYVHDILRSRGNDREIRVIPEDWNTREKSKAIATWWPGYGRIGIAENNINELTLLHEVAHILTDTVHSNAHGHEFKQTFHDLIHEKLGPEAGHMYGELAFPYGISPQQLTLDLQLKDPS